MESVQNTKHRTAWMLVVCSAIIATSAWADKKVNVDRSNLLLRDLKQIELFEQSMADYRRGNPDSPKLPTIEKVPNNFRVQHHMIYVGSDQPMVTTKGKTLDDALNAQVNAAAGEQVVYSNTQYDLNNLFGLLFKRPGSGFLMADDIGTELVENCDLKRVRIAVNGGVPGGGDNFRVFINLYDGCPESGGTPIPGTSHATPFLDNDKAIIHVIDLIFPRFQNDPLPTATPNFYLGIKFNRDEAGWLFGNPAERGFSNDNFSLSNFSCNLSSGGFPFFPHASFFAEIFADDICETEYLAYQAVSNIAEAIQIGAGNRWAEDLTLALGDQACEISSLEVGFRATGNQPYTVDIDFRAITETQGRPNTETTFNGIGGNKLEIARFLYPPGVFLPDGVFVTFSPSRDGVGIIRPGETQAGFSKNSFRAIVTDPNTGIVTWTAEQCIANGQRTPVCPQSDSSIFHVRVKCRGTAPIGACCPQQKVPTTCIGGSTPGISCKTDSDCLGGQCMLVDTPCTTSADCSLGSQCLQTCNGGIHDGLVCFTDDDCKSTSDPLNTGTCSPAVKICDRALCFDNVPVLGCLNGRWQASNGIFDGPGGNQCKDNPFIPPCGDHACCLPDNNIRDTRFEQCLRIKDPNSPATQCGQCAIAGTTGCLTDNDCPVGDTCIPNDGLCLSGQVCQSNGICAPRTAIWHAGRFQGENSFTCPIYECNFGLHDCFEEIPEIRCWDQFNNPDPDLCPEGIPCGDQNNAGICVFGGCENPVCCDLVCRDDNFCCDSFWDFNCVLSAETLCPFVPPGNDDCFCRTCSGVPFRCGKNEDCGLGADGLPRTCDLDTNVCGAQELLFVKPNAGGAPCTPDATKCVAIGESSNEAATSAPGDPVFCCNKFGPVEAIGTIWYRFIMPNASGATSARFQTCNTSDINATDSIIQIYEVADPTDRETACGSLITVGCNDDAGGSCGVGGRLSDTCVEGMIPGNEYFISLASPIPDVGGKYLLDVEIPCSLANAPPPNNDCALSDDFIPPTVTYDLNNASISCPTVDQCPTFLSDVWYEYAPQCTGILTVDTCGGGETNQFTAVAVYEININDNCPPDPVADFLGCSEVPCASVSVPVIGDVINKRYRIRVGSTSTAVPIGTLSITCTQQDCNNNGIPDVTDIADCPPGNPLCADCNNNQIPDFCDITDCPVGDVTCADCNFNDVPDACDITNGLADVNPMNGVPDVCELPPCTQPIPQSWTSIGQHGSGCTFNPACGGNEYGQDMPAGSVYSEPRSTGINKIVIVYDVDVDISGATVTAIGCDANGAAQDTSTITMTVVAGANPNEAVLSFSPSLPGNNPQIGEIPVKYDITVSGVDCVGGGAPIADETRTAWAIFGDANPTPITVNNGDLGFVRSARDIILARPAGSQVVDPNSATGMFEIRADINNDNTVSNGDLGLVRVARDSITQPSGLCP